MNSILKDVTERNGNIGKGIMKKKRKLRVLAGICVVAMTVTSLPYTAMKVSAEPEAAVQQTTADDLKLWYTSPADITKSITKAGRKSLFQSVMERWEELYLVESPESVFSLMKISLVRRTKR